LTKEDVKKDATEDLSTRFRVPGSYHKRLALPGGDRQRWLAPASKFFRCRAFMFLPKPYAYISKELHACFPTNLLKSTVAIMVSANRCKDFSQSTNTPSRHGIQKKPSRCCSASAKRKQQTWESLMPDELADQR
jgi:hypothetical protein